MSIAATQSAPISVSSMACGSGSQTTARTQRQACCCWRRRPWPETVHAYRRVWDRVSPSSGIRASAGSGHSAVEASSAGTIRCGAGSVVLSRMGGTATRSRPAR
jgi:hypothetical protein